MTRLYRGIYYDLLILKGKLIFNGKHKCIKYPYPYNCCFELDNTWYKNDVTRLILKYGLFRGDRNE
jgi:hypothetical protein